MLVPTTDGDLVPSCGYNVTTEDGAYALRNRNGWGSATDRTGAEESLPDAPDPDRSVAEEGD